MDSTTVHASSRTATYTLGGVFIKRNNITKSIENPDEDFDFDPDCFAIYRRSVEFLLPVEEKMMSIIKKLQGTDGKLTRERMWYQTCSTSSLPGIRSEFVYAVGDLHSVLI
ncbi:hypothetical protein KIN20_007920 [Parelaphostrongylus tenuis]|uniref:Uncharacterized protein n=1 Tax=Parelaphostrongylus tenuis TaxID=148309 RepID=A0AAD5M413_PARTN|nr:hypothetical protein KIN20_007920 [Parelaphostrongylus tenuis]